MVGAALSGAQTGVTLLSGAEVWAFEKRSFEEMADAVDRAGESLGLTRLNEKRTDGRHWVYFRYLKHNKLVVEVVRTTDEVTSVQIDTRKKNQQGMATLFLEEVFRMLEDQGGRG